MGNEMTETVICWPKGIRFWKPRRIYAKGALLDGQRHGSWVFWYQSGAVELEGTYERGKKHGLWTKWWENGEKRAQGRCVHGRMDGKWTEWHPSGQKARESYWVNGRKDGRWSYWRPDGTLEETKTHDHRSEKPQDHAICTDREARDMIKQINRDAFYRNWENMVGKTVARVVKPWHIACWIIIFVIGMGITKNGPDKLQGIILAAIVALFITTLLGWVVEHRSR